MMKEYSIRDLKPLALRRQQFDQKLLKMKNANDRLALVHQQLNWCNAIIKQHDHDKWSKYCHDWINVLNDGLSSVAWASNLINK